MRLELYVHTTKDRSEGYLTMYRGTALWVLFKGGLVMWIKIDSRMHNSVELRDVPMMLKLST